MLYAIGTPGNAARVYIEAGLLDMRYQVQAGEVAVPLVERPAGPVMIAADGASVVLRVDVTLMSITVAVGQAVKITVPAGATWRANGKAYVGPASVTLSAPGQYPVEMTGGYAGSATLTVLSLVAYEASLLTAVRDECERRSMLVMSPGGAKKTKYAAKAAEVENWNDLGPVGASAQALVTAFNTLQSDVRKRKFRFAIADAKIRGDQVQNAIARFTAGADASLDEGARLDAIEQAAIAAIRAAATGAGKLAAHNAINWSAVV